MAGIWAQAPVQQLCWTPANSNTFFTRPAENRAPSWSWAAVDGEVYFPSFLEVDGASNVVPYHSFHILEWRTYLKVPSLPFGEVTHGQLVVKSVLRNAISDPASEPNLRFDISTNIPLREAMGALPVGLEGSLISGRGKCDELDENFAKFVSCLPMYRCRTNRSSDVHGLMLVVLGDKTGRLRHIDKFRGSIAAFDEVQDLLVTASIVRSSNCEICKF